VAPLSPAFPSSLWLCDVSYWDWSVSELSGFCIFWKMTAVTAQICANFIQGLGGNT